MLLEYTSAVLMNIKRQRGRERDGRETGRLKEEAGSKGSGTERTEAAYLHENMSPGPWSTALQSFPIVSVSTLPRGISCLSKVKHSADVQSRHEKKMRYCCICQHGNWQGIFPLSDIE